MKKITLTITAFLFLFILMSSAHAESYVLKRVVITWDDGLVDDSMLGPFQASGSMSINGQRIVQDITLCESPGVCDHVVANSGGTVTSVAKNAAKVTIKLDDGTVGDLTLLTLSQNIITLFAYDDGTVETHEWERVNPFAKKLEKEMSGSDAPVGSIGKGIAVKLRP